MKKILFYTLLILSTISCKKEIKRPVSPPTSNHLMYNEHKECEGAGFNTLVFTSRVINFYNKSDECTSQLVPPYNNYNPTVKFKGDFVKYIQAPGDYNYVITTDGINSYIYQTNGNVQIVYEKIIENVVIIDAETYFKVTLGRVYIFFSGSTLSNHPLGSGQVVGMFDFWFPPHKTFLTPFTHGINIIDLTGVWGSNRIIASSIDRLLDIQINSFDTLTGFKVYINGLYDKPVPSNNLITNNMGVITSDNTTLYYGANNFNNTSLVRNKPFLYKINLQTNTREWQSNVHLNDVGNGIEYYYNQVFYTGTKLLAAGVAVPRYLDDLSSSQAFGNAFIDVIDSNTGELLRTHTFGNVNYRSCIKSMYEANSGYPMLRCVGYTDMYNVNDSLNMSNTNNWFSTGDHSCAWQFDVNIDEL